MTRDRIISPRIDFLTPEIDPDVASKALLSVNFQRSLLSPVGIGEIILSPNLLGSDTYTTSSSKLLDDWYHTIEPMDLLNLTIEDVNDNQPNWLVKGCVDNIFRQKQQMQTTTRRNVSIRFSDLLGKVIAKDEIAFLGPLTDDPKVKQLFTEDRLRFYEAPFGHGFNNESKQNIFIGGSITQAIEYILEKMQGTRITFTKNNRTINVSKEVYKHRSIISDPYDYVFRVDLTKFAGTVYEFILNVLDKEFYELYIDTIDDKSTLFIRPKPFETSSTQPYDQYKNLPKWDTLPTTELEDEDILSDDTGRSDYEVKTMFRCYNDLDIFGSQDSLIGRYGTNFPLINLNGVKRYGLRQYEGRSTVVNARDAMLRQSIKDGKTAETVQLADINFLDSTIRRKRNKLFRWYGYPHFESGQIVVRGDQKIRIGTRILCKDKISRRGNLGMMFYVQGVSSSWAFGSAYTQALSVTRGQESDSKDVNDYFDEIEADVVGVSKFGKLLGENVMTDDLVDGVNIYDQGAQEEIDKEVKKRLANLT